ncbi:MAG TPA: hypothetical protein VD735_03160 [Candidatus Saccharimonadales bacterium]|nr:hypothetical protein [Candidatus Saccharimonadales bacterium]
MSEHVKGEPKWLESEPGTRLRKSSYSSSGACVGVLEGANGELAIVKVDDYRRTSDVSVSVTLEGLRDFIAGVRAGEFDFPPESAPGA